MNDLEAMDLSSPKLHLPILKGYLLGEVISSHDGVRCYPALARGTEDKYILKIVSFPDCPDRLDALLLTGAVSGKKAAMEYFHAKAKDMLGQTDILHKLSHQEGFVPYIDGQIDAMETEDGYEVYLLGTYKQSLERMLRTEPMTHSEVIHMGLDLCAALAACRRAGYLYADLKPGNIFYDMEHGFRIGDVGFISLQSLKYASLPDKYRSSYTAPELSDLFATMNTTVDIYALGLVLYQAYNGGVLPFSGNAPAEELPTPMYADYEMANIILKACHPDPKQRWQQPTQMAQALIGYMTEFGAPETAIIPPVLPVEEPVEEEVEEFLPEMDEEQLQREMEDLANADPDELAFLSGLVSDETAPSDENTADVSEDVITEEISQMLAQADELINHELPEPPVAPGPIEVPMPAPIVLDDEEGTQEELTEETAEAPAEEPMETQVAEDAPETDIEVQEAAVEVKKAEKVEILDRPNRFPWRILAAAIAIVMLLGVFSIGKQHYDTFYVLQVDDLILTTADHSLTVQVVSQIDDSLLRVVCTDVYGNATQSDLVDGFASFVGLNPGTRYTIRVEAVGNHKLTGKLADTFTTATMTQILSFTAGIGPEDCSVALNLTLSGPEAKTWTVTYCADGIAPQTQDFTGRSTIIYGLEPGALYTFTLSSKDEIYLGGQTQTDYFATNILLAQDLHVVACGNGQLQVQWQQPNNGQVSQWQVRCYNASGFSQIITTDGNEYTFMDLDLTTGYTVEVTAVGMNRSVSTSVTAHPITITDFVCQLTEQMALEISWSFTGRDSVDGWFLRYSIDGGQEQTLHLTENKATILALSNGVYHFTIASADGSTIFGGEQSYTMSQIEVFSVGTITAADISVSPFLPPEGNKWKVEQIPQENFRNEYQAGESIALLLKLPEKMKSLDLAVDAQFVLHSADGTCLRTDELAFAWNELGLDASCVLNLPYVPEEPGQYLLCVYFNGAFLYQLELVIH